MFRLSMWINRPTGTEPTRHTTEGSEPLVSRAAALSFANLGDVDCVDERALSLRCLPSACRDQLLGYTVPLGLVRGEGGAVQGTRSESYRSLYIMRDHTA